MHLLFTHTQYIVKLDTELERSWVEMWLYQAPWFFNWIWLTNLIFVLNRQVNDAELQLHSKISIHFVAMLVLLFFYWTLSAIPHYYGFIENQSFYQFWKTVVFSYGQVEVFIYIAILALAVGTRMYHQMLEKRIELKQLQFALSQEQLKTLRTQLNPHFLFNALNSIASLVRLKRESEAISALSQLSQMLRKTLENKNNEDIKVKDEIAFINSYLAIQKMRFAEKLDTHINVQPDCLNINIPNMLLHPLVENAVQHGSQLESNKNPLNLSISRTSAELTIKLTNRVAIDDQHNGFGIGLSNTRARLNKLYKHFKLDLHPINGDMFETLLTIPIIGEQHAELVNR